MTLEDAVKEFFKKVKAAGLDKNTSELIEALGNWGIKRVTEVLNKIYKCGEISRGMSKSTFIILLKSHVLMDVDCLLPQRPPLPLPLLFFGYVWVGLGE